MSETKKNYALPIAMMNIVRFITQAHHLSDSISFA